MNELQALSQNAIVTAYSKKGGINELFDRVAQEVKKEVPDTSTKKGRDAIGSLAMKVSKTKKLIEDSGKALVAEQKAQIKLIDDDRISVVKMFDSLRDEILAPRDAWEQAEKDRVAKHENAIKEITDFLLPENINVDAEVLASNIRYLEKVPMGTMFEEYEEKIKIAKLETLEKLRTALVAREKYEAEQAELERLRQADIERQQKERDEKIARDAAEKARIEAEQKAQAEREKAEQERKEAIEKIEREKIEAEQREARLKLEKEQAELREQQLKQQAIEREKQAEIDRQNAVEAERLRIEQEAKVKADTELKEQQAREANKAHKKNICDLILIELAKLNIGEETGKELIKAIHKGDIPNISIRF